MLKLFGIGFWGTNSFGDDNCLGASRMTEMGLVSILRHNMLVRVNFSGNAIVVLTFHV